MPVSCVAINSRLVGKTVAGELSIRCCMHVNNTGLLAIDGVRRHVLHQCPRNCSESFGLVLLRWSRGVLVTYPM